MIVQQTEILLIEGDKREARKIRDMLCRQPVTTHRVKRVGRLSQALDFLANANGQIAVVLADLSLPDCEGLRTFLKVQAHAPVAPIIVLGDSGHEADGLEAVRRGAQDYLIKEELEARTLQRAVLHAIERKRAQNKFELAVESAPNAILMVDDGGRIILANSTTEKLFHYSRDELIGESVEILMPDRFRSDHKNHLPRFFANPGTREMGAGRDLYALRKDGIEFPVEIGLNPIETDEGMVVLAAIVDITDRKRAEERLLQSERLSAIGEAMSSLAHESRNALQRSRISVEMLESIVSDRHEAAEWIEELAQAQTDLHRLYEEVCSFAAPIRLNVERHHIGQLVQAAWNQATAPHTSDAARFHEQSDDCDLNCQVDALAMRHIILNIFDNALSACDEAVELDVTYADSWIQRRPALQISLSDNGPGLPRGHSQQVFDAFYTTKSSGTGLGLAIARRLVEAHGGNISATSRPNGGAEFIINLPRDGQ